MNEKLTMDELQYVQNEVKLKGKSLGLSYALLTFFGLFGIHYAYLEKGKLALMRILLTIATIASFYPVKGIVYTSETEGLTLKLQMFSSSLLVTQVVLLILLAALTIYDFVKLTTMIRIKNEQIENEAKEKSLQSRNVIAKIREQEISKVMIEKISSELESELKLHSEEIVKSLSSKIGELDKKDIENEEIEQFTEIESTENQGIELEKEQETETSENNEKEIIPSESPENNEPILEEVESINVESFVEEVEATEVEIEAVESFVGEIKNPESKFDKIKKHITVDEALIKKNGQFTIKGYIIGCLDSTGKVISTNGNNSNLLIATNSQESNLDNMLVIQLNENMKSNFGLQNNPSLVGNQIVAEGRIKNYYGKKGLKNVSKIEAENI